MNQVKNVISKERAKECILYSKSMVMRDISIFHCPEAQSMEINMGKREWLLPVSRNNHTFCFIVPMQCMYAPLCTC